MLLGRFFSEPSSLPLLFLLGKVVARRLMKEFWGFLWIDGNYSNPT